MPADTVLLDACCVINLYATRCMRGLLGAGLHQYIVAERVVSESLYVRNLPSTEIDAGVREEQEEREAVNLEPFLAEHLLSVITAETDEEATIFVQFATQLDDGEAMTCALASARGFAVATDDRKAQRLLQELVPAVRVYSTPMLLKEWAEQTAPDAATLAQVIRDIHERARFVPGRHDPLQEWWESSAR